MSNFLQRFLKLHKVSILLALLSVVFYYTFGYHLARTDFITLLTLFAALFVLWFKLIQYEKWNFRFLLAVGIVFRMVFLLAEPNLSQDFYRFIWDGHLVTNAINPYLYTPNMLMENMDFMIPNARELHKGMGSLSAKHYSNYPPLNQLIFTLSAFFGGQNILSSLMFLRATIIVADIGIFYFGRKLLKNLNKSPHLIFWYFLNPLVIIELSGNLHFEGVMLFFFILSIYLLSIKKWQLAAALLACSISIKLIPLLFLPLFINYLGWKKSLAFYLIVAFFSLLLFAPFYTQEFIQNYSDTLSLWFSNFEFNASLYNVIKRIAVECNAKPWELIKVYGQITPIVMIATVFLFALKTKKKDLNSILSSMMWVLTIYYFIATTVHPWYSIYLVLLAVFTSYRFALVWSGVVVLSYYAYSQPEFRENLWLLAVEYSVVYGFLIYEIITHHNKK